MTNDEKAVRTVIENWARAVESCDRKGILANHADDLLMFDFPDVVRGLEAYDKTWDFFFDKPKGPIRYMPKDLVVTAGDQVAFATCLVHCDGTSAGALDFRLTTGVKKTRVLGRSFTSITQFRQSRNGLSVQNRNRRHRLLTVSYSSHSSHDFVRV